MNETVRLWRDARAASREGPDGVRRRQRERLAELVAFAREASPYFREQYRDLPGRVEDPSMLPVTDKRTLVAHFDDWLTDRTVTRADVEKVLADPGRVGERFRDAYLVATTSGTSGHRGVYLLDDRVLTVAAALGAARIRLGDVVPALVKGMRTAMVIATGGHYVGVAGATRAGGEGRRTRILSVHTPLPELVAELNRFRPAFLVGYASMIKILAAEQEAGRLRIAPAVVMPGGETLTIAELERIGIVFGARVRSTYAATECTILSASCRHHWHHVNADWVIFEPVDAHHRPVPPGEPSHTVLVTNLANRVQPFLRYDLGDSVLVRPDPCPCGSRLPAVRVQGRASDVLILPGADGADVRLSPLAFASLLDRVPGVERFQLVQTAPAVLRVRFVAAPDVEPEATWRAIRDEIAGVLAGHGLDGVVVERGGEEPEQAPGGKYRTVIPLA